MPLTKEGPFYSHLCSEFHIFIQSGDTLSVSKTKLHSSGRDAKSNHPDYGSQTYITGKKMYLSKLELTKGRKIYFGSWLRSFGQSVVVYLGNLAFR